MGSAGRSYQDDIIRELARNNCGATYAQEARRRDAGPVSSIWQDDEGGGGTGGQFGALPFATYRTLCVRLCDGYCFPVSFSTCRTTSSATRRPASRSAPRRPSSTITRTRAARSTRWSR